MKKIYFLFSILFSVTVAAQIETTGTIVTETTPIIRDEFTSNKSGGDLSSSRSAVELTVPTGNSQEVGITEGTLAVSPRGGANYSIDIAVPPGINSVVPTLSLYYSSQASNGTAGYGWDIGGISSIRRIGATKFHDGTIDGVDFDNLDRFSFDGQRLMRVLPNAVYGGNGTVYQTESYGNIKITSYGVSPFGATYGPAYFIVEYPDGAKAYYGNSSDSRTRDEWSITFWENPQGIRISYTYNNFDNILNINTVKYGAQGLSNPINEVRFIYSFRSRHEDYYIGDYNFLNTKILKQINVIGNGTGFRNYILAHNTTALGYERLISITEKTGDSQKVLNPTTFTYNDLDNNMTVESSTGNFPTTNTTQLNTATIPGDFLGNGRMDFILYPTVGSNAKSEYWLFTNIHEGDINNVGLTHFVGKFEDIQPVAFLGTFGTGNFKLMPNQGWDVIKRSVSTNLTTFSIYAAGPASPSSGSEIGIFSQYTKQYTFPKFTLSYYNQCVQGLRIEQPPIEPGEPVLIQVSKDILKEYLHGDFNGDGLTDVIVIEKPLDYSYVQGCNTYTLTNPGGKTYFVNLDKRITSNYVNVAGYMTTTKDSKFKMADVNGDGKLDIMVFDLNKVRTYSLNDSNQIVQLFLYQDLDIVVNDDRPILIGDYNGDGKFDFIIPRGFTQNFSKFMSTGTKFIKVNQTYMVKHSEMVNYTTMFDYYDLIPNDINKDGKTDLISIKYRVDKMNNNQSNFDINVKIYSNQNNNFLLTSEQDLIPNFQHNTCLPVPIFLTADKLNNDSELGLAYGNKIIRCVSSKDSSKEMLLRKITLGNGITESISYNAMVGEGQNSSHETIYVPSTLTENFPNSDITAARSFNLVSQIEHQSASHHKKQLFLYYGAVSNLEGLDFLGFRGTLQTNWFDDNHPRISNVTRYDISKRGAVNESFSVLNVFSDILAAPVNFIAKTNITVESELLPNKVFKVKNTSSITYNGLDNTSSAVVTGYDSLTNLPNSVVTTTKLGATTQQIQSVSYLFDNPSIAPHVMGRVQQKSTSTSIYPGQGDLADIFTGEEVFTYENNLLTKLKRKGHNTDHIIEDYEYDPFGNVKSRKITAGTLQPRTTTYVYEPSGRFLQTKVDQDSLATHFDFNSSTGLKLSETNAFGLTTRFEYDKWGKRIATFDYLDNKTDEIYSWIPNQTGAFSILANGEDGSSQIKWFDDSGNNILEGAKNVDGTWAYVAKTYDIYHRTRTISEPYNNISAGSSYFNTYNFNNYGFPSGGTVNQKVINTSYVGLVTTTVDGDRTTITTKDAIGNIVSVNDNAGTVNYRYFANGNLKKTIYTGAETATTEIEQNGWGFKTKLTDLSAGIYEYRYNALNELTKEITLKGITTYTLDDTGKVLERTIVGDETNSKTIYSYDQGTKLVTSSIHHDYFEGVYTTYSYHYDDKMRLDFYDESGFLAYYQRATFFDGYGRPEKELYTAINTSDSQQSNIWIKNVYKNGHKWKILEDATGKVLWEAGAVNGRGQLSEISYGNGMKITETYDQYGFPQQSKHDYVNPSSGVASNRYTMSTTFNHETGNLTNRTISLFYTNESFVYDEFDRITQFTNLYGQDEFQNYDSNGRITANALGSYNYNHDSIFHNSSIELVPESYAHYSNREGIFNDSMESGGWTVHYDPTAITYDSTSARTGDTSIKIHNTTSTEKMVFSEVWVPVQNTTPTQYTYSCWVKGTGAQAEMFMYMQTSTGLLFSQVTIQSTNSWQYLSGTFTVPANVTQVSLRFDCNNTGTIWFDDARIKKTSSPATPLREQIISYGAFKNPIQIEETGVDKVSFAYNLAGARSTMFYGGLQTDRNQRPDRKYYSADGFMEIKHNIVTGKVEFFTYIGGNAYSAPIVYNVKDQSDQFLYLHRDYQGSILAISDEQGVIVEKRLFDVWGNIIKVQDQNGTGIASLMVLDRGYTGHEHIATGLIHMNGRLYDPKLHRFLQPDNNIQDPYNTQSFNRFSYCWNNPAKYTDPSGEIIPLIIVAVLVVSAGINVYQNWDDITNNSGKLKDVNWGKFAGYAGTGAVSGALTIYGGPWGVVWAGGVQGLLNSVIKGDDGFDIIQNTIGGVFSGAISMGVGMRFDQMLPNGILGGNNLFNKVLSETTREVMSSVTANFATSLARGGFDFKASFKTAFDPFSIIASAASGALTGVHNFNSQPAYVRPTVSPVIENLQLRTTVPYVVPIQSILIPIIPPALPPIRTVVPPAFYLPQNRPRL